MAKTKQEITQTFARAVSAVRLAFKQYIQYAFKTHGIDLTFEMLQVMVCLWQKDGVNQQELADKTDKDKASMTYLIDNLAKRKLVLRQEDGNDRRNKLIFLTPAGRALKTQLQPLVMEMYEVAGRNIPVQTMTDLMPVLERICANLKTGD